MLQAKTRSLPATDAYREPRRYFGSIDSGLLNNHSVVTVSSGIHLSSF